ncbi:MAG TPA: type IV pili methyl-accepting chemotaxis transducer N-terminal domain-containing protein [Ramlibacter sp.]|nr:type IV pili methyl-accepting chemotaxis transducer N-terminal domain-containing protein [Ramlibacter sp.]
MKRRIFIASAAMVGMSVHSQVTDMNDAINKAGRQRMLSQRISKAYLAMVQKVEPGSAQQVLDRSLALFDRQLVELKAFAPAGEVRETYVKLERSWSDFKSELVGAAPSRDHALKVIQMDAAILTLANQGTQQYEKLVSRPVGNLVNVAGRQRMLSQRMAKFFLASTLQLNAPASVAEIAKAKTEFLAAQEVLRSAPEATAKIKDELALADAQWVFFDQGLQRPDAARQSPKLMSDVFVSSENLLSVMDRVTGLYSALKA